MNAKPFPDGISRMGARPEHLWSWSGLRENPEEPSLKKTLQDFAASQDRLKHAIADRKNPSLCRSARTTIMNKSA